MSRKILPPLKRDWRPGATQLGLFIRFPDGSTMEITENSAPDDVAAAAKALLLMMAKPRNPVRREPLKDVNGCDA